MKKLHPTTTQRVLDARLLIDFEDDTHRAALEDNPEHVRVSFSTWASVFFLALSFEPPLGLAFVSFASIVQPVTTQLGDPEQLTWVAGAWSLASAVSFSLAGPLSDVFGRRLPMLFGQSLTVLGCIICAVAKNVPTLIAGETVVGLAIGTIFVAYAGVPEMLPNKWRSVGLGILEGGVAVPWAIISVVMASALLVYSTWRWIFYIGIIVSIIALIGIALTYWPSPRPRGDYDKSRWDEVTEIDWLALILFTRGLTTFLIGLTWGGSAAHPWSSAGTIAPTVVGSFGFIGAFVYDALLAKNPMFPSKLIWKFRQFGSLLVLVFIAGMTFYPMASLLPRGFLYMFTNDGLKIGVYALPNTIMQGILGVLCPMLATSNGN